MSKRDLIVDKCVDEIIDFAKRLNIYDLSMRGWMNDPLIKRETCHMIWKAISEGVSQVLDDIEKEDNKS